MRGPGETDDASAPRSAWADARRTLAWAGILVLEFVVALVLFVAVTGSFFSLGGGIGSGLLTVFAGGVAGIVCSVTATPMLAGICFSGARPGRVVVWALPAAGAAGALTVLAGVVLGSFPDVVRSLTIYVNSPGGGVMPRDAALLAKGGLTAAALVLSANVAAGVVVARVRRARGRPPESKRMRAALRWAWWAEAGAGAAGAAVIAWLFISAAAGGRPPAIHAAIESGSIEQVRSVLASDPSAVRARDWQRVTPLELAVRRGSPETVRLLLAAGADVDDSGKYNTPLCTAVTMGNAELVGLLLQSGASPDRGTSFEICPLHEAVARGNEKIVQLLIQHGADLNVERARDHKTPLDVAISGGFDTIAEMLRAHGAAAGQDR